MSPRSTSPRSVYKGALQSNEAPPSGSAQGVIQDAAEGTDTYEMNRNLVLTDGARVDSVPNLEIGTGEIVGAGHASATGRFVDEQLFYLQCPRHPGRGGPPPGRASASSPSWSSRAACPDVEARLLDKIETELKASV
ncbi:Fe-S cluster assembly protein SufD OS=Streptomyces microflavus OX=1919 GN=Smic_16340 PE=4 SV=1 [Streptomyces microflavus]